MWAEVGKLVLLHLFLVELHSAKGKTFSGQLSVHVHRKAEPALKDLCVSGSSVSLWRLTS